MGLLTVGRSLSPEETLELSEYIRDHGVTQFLVTWNRVKDIQGTFTLLQMLRSLLSCLASHSFVGDHSLLRTFACVIVTVCIHLLVDIP